ncbi:MAG: hypothetical protein E7269_05665, partial [Lachnospiraceae bacterium]|nr:hypothetical protein [Lachnospiraceae bacterium]
MKKKGMRVIAFVLTFIMALSFSLENIGLQYVSAAVSNPNVNYVNNSAYASVHDPVILKSGKTYYMYSTGIIGWGVELRTSTDLVNWTYVSDFAASHDDELKVSAVMSATNNATSNIWAPEVIQVGNEYWMYYSCSAGGTQNSCIALAKATNPAGPFTYAGIVLQTYIGMSSWMNGIDASIEYDQSGNMWMSYGSFFGGIRVVQLNSSTGFLKTSGDEGTLIASRPSSIDSGAVEAPVIRYHDGYYYLFVSYDNLFGPERGGGGSYHVRVGRSKTINGTYVDQDGVSMINAGETTGYKLTANYKFNNGTGWWAVGHCDIYEENDKWIYVSHARVNGNEGAPYSFIHQMTWNEDGWPVISPEPYVGETIGTMTVADAAGKYERIAFHDNKETLARTLTSVEMKLNSDYTATISGISGTGTWSFSGDNTVTVKVGSVTERYTLMEAWDAENSKATVVLTGNDTSTQLQRWAKRTEQYAAPGYSIKVSSNNTSYGTVSGGGTVNSGNSVTVRATAKSGYSFIHWVDDSDNVVSTSASYTFKASKNMTLTAMFTNETRPTITVASNNTSYGTVSGGGTVSAGSQVTLVATPVGGSRFVAWKDSSNNVLSESATYTMRAYKSQTVTAYFEPLSASYVADYLSDGSKFYDTLDSTGKTIATLYGSTSVDNEGIIVRGTAGDAAPTNYVRMTNPLKGSDAEAITVSAYMTINETADYDYKTLFTFYTSVGFFTITANGGIHLNDWNGNYFDSVEKTWTPDGTEHLYSVVVTDSSVQVFEDATLINSYACSSILLSFIQSCDYISLGTGNDTFSDANGGWSWGSASTKTSEFIVMDVALTENDFDSMVSGGEPCTITVKAVGFGSVTGPSETVNAGKTVTVVATPNSGYRFAYWKNSDGEIVSTSASYTFKVKEDTTLTAYFLSESQFVDVTVTSEDSSKGTVTGGAKDVIIGTEMTIIAKPASYYKFAGWKVGSSIVSTKASYTFTVKGDASYVAVFEIDEDQIATKTFVPQKDDRLWAYYSFDSNVTNQVNDSAATIVAAGGGASASVPQYNTAENYTVDGVSKTGTSIQTGSYGLKLANDIPVGSTKFTISFWMKTYNYHGNYTSMFYLYNSDSGDWTSILMNTPVNSNGCIQTWSEVDGTQTNATTSTAANSGQWNNVILTVDGAKADLYINGEEQISDLAVGEIFDTNNYSIYVAANPWSADGLFYAAYDELYIYEGVLDSSEIAILANGGNYNNGDFNSVTLTLQSNISGAGTLYGPETVITGNEATIIARATEGYTFVKWQDASGNTVSTNEVYTFTASSAATYTAVFEKSTSTTVTYTVSATASPSAGGSVSGAGTYEKGASVTLKATANNGYTFKNWTVGGSVVSTSATYTISSLSANTTVVANFTQNQVEEETSEPIAYYISNGTKFYDTITGTLTGTMVGAATVNRNNVTVTYSGAGDTGYTNYVQMENPFNGTTVDEVTISLLGTVEA